MGRLILIRHGQSIWNQQNRFTGWIDISLSAQGIKEAQQAAALLTEQHFDLAFTSNLLRAQDTLYEILKQNRHCNQYLRIHETGREWYEHFKPTDEDEPELKIYISEKLNERYYGDLQGLNKNWAKKHFGAEQVHRWRRSYDIPPPNGESLAMTATRALPYFQSRITPVLQRGKHVLISAHGNSLRAIIMHIERMSAEQILAYELKTGTPHIYEFDEHMQILEKYILN
ncbi:Phosphoglycerate mutase [hydrothermal vent metagenome]|uniref:phosphoglycerate mutase (2,3-diphosphoglycerate-dependent) n=1 Tax=hydrothermal vent metagenome TaxID=652676 RepID=A0A3B1BDZ4_9ZZZZ